MPVLPEFALRVEGSLDGEGDLPVQTGQFASRYIPVIRTKLESGSREIVLRGIEPGGSHWVYVGPTSDGRRLYWVGRTPAGGRSRAVFSQGEPIWGHVTLPSGTILRSLDLEVTARAAVCGLRLVSQVDAEGEYEIPGLIGQMNWWVQAEGKTESGVRVHSERVQCSPGRREDLLLEEAR